MRKPPLFFYLLTRVIFFLSLNLLSFRVLSLLYTVYVMVIKILSFIFRLISASVGSTLVFVLGMLIYVLFYGLGNRVIMSTILYEDLFVCWGFFVLVYAIIARIMNILAHRQMRRKVSERLTKLVLQNQQVVKKKK